MYQWLSASPDGRCVPGASVRPSQGDGLVVVLEDGRQPDPVGVKPKTAGLLQGRDRPVRVAPSLKSPKEDLPFIWKKVPCRDVLPTSSMSWVRTHFTDTGRPVPGRGLLTEGIAANGTMPALTKSRFGSSWMKRGRAPRWAVLLRKFSQRRISAVSIGALSSSGGCRGASGMPRTDQSVMLREHALPVSTGFAPALFPNASVVPMTHPGPSPSSAGGTETHGRTTSGQTCGRCGRQGHQRTHARPNVKPTQIFLSGGH